MTEPSKCSAIAASADEVCGFDRCGDARVALNVGQAFGVSGAAIPADAPCLAGDHAERAYDKGEERVARGDGDRAVEGDVVLHYVGRMREGLAHRGGPTAD